MQIEFNPELVSYCGLYCGTCSKYKKGKCPGCKGNTKATWCKTRTCNIDKNYTSCADCSIADLRSCKINNNFVASIFGFIFKTDRMASLELIRKIGREEYAKQMTEVNQMALKKNQTNK